MKVNGIPLFGSYCLFFVASLLTLSGCQSRSTTGEAQGKTPATSNLVAISPESFQGVQMKTEPIERRRLSQQLHVPGRIQADVSKEIDVSSRFCGRVVQIFVRPGSRVKAGQVLAMVDSHELSELQAELLKANSELNIAQAHEEREQQIFQENKLRPRSLIEAQARFSETKVQLDLAESDFKRVQSLYREKIASQKDLLATGATLSRIKVVHLAAESELQRQKSFYKNEAMLRRDLQLAKAETARAQQNVITLKQRLSFLGMPEAMVQSIQKMGRIHASVPIVASAPGIITDQNVAAGEMITPENNLFTVTDLTTVVAKADIPEIDLRFVRIGGPVKVKVAAYPEETFHGVINFISENVNPTTRAATIRAQLNNPDHRLKGQMFADIDVPGATAEILSCPRDAIQERKGKKVVYVSVKYGYKESVVETGQEYKDYVEIKSGLKEGDLVATQGSLLLKTAMTAPKREGKHD